MYSNVPYLVVFSSLHNPSLLARTFLSFLRCWVGMIGLFLVLLLNGTLFLVLLVSTAIKTGEIWGY